MNNASRNNLQEWGKFSLPPLLAGFLLIGYWEHMGAELLSINDQIYVLQVNQFGSFPRDFLPDVLLLPKFLSFIPVLVRILPLYLPFQQSHTLRSLVPYLCCLISFFIYRLENILESIHIGILTSGRL